jgi:DNA-binding NarL/FixJ family response regulator
MIRILETAKNKETSTDVQIAFSYEVEATVMPLLQKLKEASADRLQTTHLINILESNLKHLVKTYGRPTSLAAAYRHLTPVEALVASMVRQGESTHVIAATLNIAAGTVSIHRKHIRKKLGLDSKAINLRSHLLSLTEHPV